jgi:predicted Zn-dependent protease
MLEERYLLGSSGMQRYLAFVAVVTLGCATSPTGRRQLVMFPEGEMAQIGAQAFSQVKQQTPPTRTGEVQEYVECIARQTLAEAHHRDRDLLPPDKWEVVVFDDEAINAFALPGGKVGVYMGMVRFAETPDQLAAVVGHEIGHVIARHGNERLSQALAAQSALAVVDMLTKDTQASQLALAALGVGTAVGIQLPHSRTQEREADEIGLQLMADAGFNPEQAVRLWQRMAKNSPARVPQFLSTHPNPESRAQDLARMLPKARQRYASARNRVHCDKPSVPEIARNPAAQGEG